jgi:uroporphyrin-3 C-methyltransferase
VLAREFSDVMSIRKATDPQALLLSEEQAIQLRANVRAMLLSAQLALMTRQSDIWRSELTQVQSLLNTRFDTQALDTKAALTVLNELLAAPVAVPVPQISDTLSALATADRAIAIPIDTGGEQPQAQEPEGSDESKTPETPASEGSAPMQGT